MNRAVEDPFEERVPVGLHLASTTQKATAVDRNNVYTTASCGVLLHCRCGELTRVDPGKVGPTDSLVRISREMDDVYTFTDGSAAFDALQPPIPHITVYYICINKLITFVTLLNLITLL